VTGRVQIARAVPTPASTARVKRLHDLGNGVIVVYPTPGRGGEGIARDVLQAFGKRFRDRTPRDPRRLIALALPMHQRKAARDTPAPIAGLTRAAAPPLGVALGIGKGIAGRLLSVSDRPWANPKLDG
jgi:hypothetical protein